MLSSLQPDLAKSSLFHRGVDDDRKAVLHGILSIPEATLPVKYLGIPLITSRLKYSECTAIKEKTLSRILSWANKILSYGVRMQLINSVL